MHLTDRHALTWDKFSVYLTGDDKHLRELEALLIRIAAPKENLTKTKFRKAKNLGSQLKGDIAWFQRQERNEIFGSVEEYLPRKRKKAAFKIDYQKKEASLKPYISIKKGYFKIYANWKGKGYKAVVIKSGHIKYKGKVFSSPSVAAKRISNETHALNGWYFWRYKDPKTGNLAPLDALRRG
jgi:hypothetical protein